MDIKNIKIFQGIILAIVGIISALFLYELSNIIGDMKSDFLYYVSFILKGLSAFSLYFFFRLSQKRFK